MGRGFGRMGSGGKAGISAFTPSRLAGLVSAWSANQAAISSGTSISSVTPYGAVPVFQQEGSGFQPTLTSGRIKFTSTSSQFLSANRIVSASTVTLPNGAGGSSTGKGFTCTGLVRDTTDGTWWVGNYGKTDFASSGAATFAASIVHMSGDFSAIIAEITLASLGITQNTTLAGPQGVTIDTSDNTIWFASPETNTVYHISKAGALLGSLPTVIAVANGAGSNGLTYDPVAGQLVTMLADSVVGDSIVVSWFNKTTGAVTRTITVSALWGSDHLFINPAEPGYLYLTGGGDVVAQPDTILKVNAATGAVVASYSLIGTDAVEGLYILGSTMYVANDAFFHNSELNQIVTYPLPTQTNVYPAIAPRYQIFGTAHIPASLASSHCLISLGWPLKEAAGPSGAGAGLYFPSGSTALLRFLVGAPIAIPLAFDWAVTTTTAFLFFLDVDTVGQTAALYLNGTLVSSQSTAAATPVALGAVPIVLGASNHDGTLSRFTNADIGNIGVTNGEQANQQKIEGWAAWDAGLQALLPGGHPYKNAPP